jgi:hypothetical protein
VSKGSGFYPRVQVDGQGKGVVSQAGGVLLVQTVRAAGLDVALWQALTPWRKPTAIHDPGKVLLDLAVAVGLGGDCLADIAVVRSEPAVFELVASDPTVSRTVDALAVDAGPVLRAINTARAAARERVWQLAGQHAPSAGVDAGAPLVIDVDATLVTAHSDKEGAAPTSVGSVIIRCGRSPTMARAGPGNHWPCCCGPGTPAAIPHLITSA